MPEMYFTGLFTTMKTPFGISPVKIAIPRSYYCNVNYHWDVYAIVKANMHYFLYVGTFGRPVDLEGSLLHETQINS